jgi:hypothetical protein
VQAARLELAGIEFRSLVEEFLPEGGATPQRFFEEHFVVEPQGAFVSQAYTIAAGVYGNAHPTTVTDVAAFDGDIAVAWSSSSLEAVVHQGAGNLPRFSPEFSFFTAWFPVPYNAPGTAAVDLVDMLSKGDLEVAPYTQTVDGVSCIVVRSPSAEGLRTTLWLDPDRSWFPRLHRIESDLGVISEWHIDEFASSGGVAWIPSSGTFRHWDERSATPTNELIERRLSLAGGPTVAAGSDLIAIPAGSTVIDATASAVPAPDVVLAEATRELPGADGSEVTSSMAGLSLGLLGLTCVLGAACALIGTGLLVRDRFRRAHT